MTDEHMTQAVVRAQNAASEPSPEQMERLKADIRRQERLLALGTGRGRRDHRSDKITALSLAAEVIGGWADAGQVSGDHVIEVTLKTADRFMEWLAEDGDAPAAVPASVSEDVGSVPGT